MNAKQLRVLGSKGITPENTLILEICSNGLLLPTVWMERTLLEPLSFFPGHSPGERTLKHLAQLIGEHQNEYPERILLLVNHRYISPDIYHTEVSALQAIMREWINVLLQLMTNKRIRDSLQKNPEKLSVGVGGDSVVIYKNLGEAFLRMMDKLPSSLLA